MGAVLGGRVAGLWLLALLTGGAAAAQSAAPPAIPVGTIAVQNRAVTESLTVVGRIAAVDPVNLTPGRWRSASWSTTRSSWSRTSSG